MLYDFGKRGSEVEEARQDSIRANWTHDAAVQNLILRVQQAYYQYLSAQALVAAQEVSLKGAQTAFDSAQNRHQAGVATVADELQAKTALAQAQLALDTTRGQIEILTGTLAVAIGIPPSQAQFQLVDVLPENVPVDQVAGDVQKLILESSR